MWFFESLWEDFRMWPWGTIAASAVYFVILSLVGFLFWGLYEATDHWGLTEKTGNGKVVVKEFVKAHKEEDFIMAGKVLIFYDNDIPDKWFLDVEIAGRVGRAEVSKEFFNDVNEGDCLAVKYASGRISGNPFIHWLSQL